MTHYTRQETTVTFDLIRWVSFDGTVHESTATIDAPDASAARREAWRTDVRAPFPADGRVVAVQLRPVGETGPWALYLAAGDLPRPIPLDRS